MPTTKKEDVPSRVGTPVETIADGFNMMKSKLRGKQTINWSAVVESDEGLSVLTRLSQPCYGELRRYQSKSERADDDTRRPGDLRHPFPDNIYRVYQVSTWYPMEDHPFIDWLINKPYLELDIVKEHVNKGNFLCIRNTNHDATFVVSFLLAQKNFRYSFPMMTKLLEHLPEDQAMVAGLCFTQGWSNTEEKVYIKTHFNEYTLCSSTPIYNFVNGKYQCLAKGTMLDARDYNRKHIHDVFKAEVPDGMSQATFEDLQTEGMSGEKVLPFDALLKNIQTFFDANPAA